MEDLDREVENKQDPPSHLLVLALEKANSAVLQDSMGDQNSALKLYHETVEMLQQVIDITEPQEDRLRLDKIRTSYLERIESITKKQDSESSSLDSPPTFDKDLPPTPIATKANSLFSSVFSKKVEASSSSTSKSTFFIKMKPSVSTPIPSISKSSSLWKLNGKRSKNSNNRRSTDLTDFNKKSDCDPEVPALPSLEKYHDHSEDLFDLHTKSTLVSAAESRKSTDTESTLSADGEVIKGTAEKLDLIINTPVIIQAEMAGIHKKSNIDNPMNELEQTLSQAEEAVSNMDKQPSMKLFTPSSRTSSRKSSIKKPKESTTEFSSKKSDKQSSGFGTLFKAHRLLPQKSFESVKVFHNNKSTVSVQTMNTEPIPPTPLKPARKNTLKMSARKWSVASSNESSMNLSQITKSSTNLFSSSVSKHLAKVQQQTSGSPTRVKSMCFLEEPSKESKNDLPQDAAASTFLLMDRLHKSMTQGGYISTRLHVPMDLWYQKSVRLPVLDAKITACEVLISLLDKMDSRHTFDNTGNVSRDLKTLDNTLNQIKYTLIRKLQYIQDKGQHGMMPQYKTYIGILSKDNSSKTSQTFASWGSKLTKSMERINMTINPHDQMNVYVKTLLRLFTSAQVLVRWSERLQERYEQSKGEIKPINERILNAHNECVEQFGVIFCGFILRDYTILLDKWMKRAQEWTLD